MKLPYFLSSPIYGSVTLTCISAARLADGQDAEPPLEAAEEAPADAESAEPGAPEPAAPAAPPEPAMAPTPEPEPTPAAPPPEEPAEPAPPEDVAPAVNFALYADAYASYNPSRTGSPVPYHRAYANNTPYDPVTGFPSAADGSPAALANRGGFGLSFVGLDASFDTGMVGATAILRLGPSVPIFYGTDAGAAGIDAMLAGYVTIKPSSALSFDVGYFGTIYGAEVAESWLNANYSRGGLYYAMQPFYHFGIKGSYAISDMVSVTAMAVNGANNVADENAAPAFGLQLSLAGMGDVFDLAAGLFYETGDDSSWGIETFFDVVATLSLGDLTVIGNFDYNIDRGVGDAEDTSYYGVMGTLAYAVSPMLGVAARGEYLVDPDNTVWSGPGGEAFTEETNVVTLTGTLDLKPFPHLIIRPEVRYETSSEDIFTDDTGAATSSWYTAMIGFVATSSN